MPDVPDDTAAPVARAPTPSIPGDPLVGVLALMNDRLGRIETRLEAIERDADGSDASDEAKKKAAEAQLIAAQAAAANSAAWRTTTMEAWKKATDVANAAIANNYIRMIGTAVLAGLAVKSPDIVNALLALAQHKISGGSP